MERLPPATLVATARQERPNVVWVPDEEVTQCPLCSRQFGVLRGRHHCRACGCVVCGSCSTKGLRLAGPGTSKQRVCDTCWDLRQHHKTASLTEDLDSKSQMEASLKAAVQEKHQQATWYRNFLNKVCVEGEEVLLQEGDSSKSVDTESTTQPSEEGLTPRSAALRKLEDRARKLWRFGRLKLDEKQQEGQKLVNECEALDAQLQDRSVKSQRVQQEIQGFQLQLNQRDRIEAEREALQVSADRLSNEFQGLTERMRILQAQMPSPVGSFASFGSFISFDGTPSNSDWRRRICCMRPT